MKRCYYWLLTLVLGFAIAMNLLVRPDTADLQSGLGRDLAFVVFSVFFVVPAWLTLLWFTRAPRLNVEFTRTATCAYLGVIAVLSLLPRLFG
jgi:hypothetical protein